MSEKHNCMDYFEIGGGCSICNRDDIYTDKTQPTEVSVLQELKELCEKTLLQDDGSLSETNRFWRRQGYEILLQFIKQKQALTTNGTKYE